MQIDKQQIIDILKNRGDGEKAQEAETELPEKLDTDEHAGLLSKYGVEPGDLMDKLPGGLGG